MKILVGRVRVVAGSGAGVVGSAGTLTGSNCWPAVRVRSKTARVFWGTPETTPLPSMLTSARPSLPVSTPCGIEGSTTLCTTRS